MEFVDDKLLIPCIGKFEYMTDLFLLPYCSEIEIKLTETYRRLGM